MANFHTTLSALFSAIADAIRSKTGSTEQIVADDFPTAIDSISTGTPLPTLTDPAAASDILDGKEAIDGSGNLLTGTYEAPYDFKDATQLAQAFYDANTFTTNKIVINAPNATTLSALFRKATFLPNTELTINAPNTTNVWYVVGQASNVVTLHLNVDWDKITRADGICYGCGTIETIDAIINYSGAIDYLACQRLQNIRYAPNCIENTTRFASCTRLTAESVISIGNGLKDGVTGQTLSLHATPKARTLEIMGTVSQFTENEVTYNFFTADESGTTSLNAFITTIKGWTLA